MNKLLLYVVLGPLLFIAACNEQDPRCARLPSEGQYCLQPTTALAAFDAQQIVEASFAGRKETLIMQLESSSDGLRLVALTPFGQKLLQMHYDNRNINITTAPGANFDPVLLVSLLQLALWPADSVRKGLNADMSLEESGNTRRILYRNEVMLTAIRTGTKPPYNRILLSIPAVKLEVDIKSLTAPPTMEKEP